MVFIGVRVGTTFANIRSFIIKSNPSAVVRVTVAEGNDVLYD